MPKPARKTVRRSPGDQANPTRGAKLFASVLIGSGSHCTSYLRPALMVRSERTRHSSCTKTPKFGFDELTHPSATRRVVKKVAGGRSPRRQPEKSLVMTAPRRGARRHNKYFSSNSIPAAVEKLSQLINKECFIRIWHPSG